MTKRPDYYTELDTGDESHPVTTAVEAHLLQDAKIKQLYARIRHLNKQLCRHLQGKPLKIFLNLEAAMNERTYLLYSAHFNAGVEHGLHRRIITDIFDLGSIDQHLDPAAAIAALARAIDRLAEGHL